MGQETKKKAEQAEAVTGQSAVGKEAIAKLDAFQRFGSVLGLSRMTALMTRLGNPQDKLKVLHVAGTNGKGSICRYLSCVLSAAGYRTGLYLSPYITIFNERIQVDGAYISDEALAAYTDRVLAEVKAMTDEGQPSPTEFEVITAIAFLYFAEMQCDYVVLEVGLGGRGDSTNIVKNPLVSVIASISFDHMDRLGHTLTAIAGEKAGIIKDGCPVITSAEAEEALTVLRQTAIAHDAPYVETRQIPCTMKAEGLWGSRFDAVFQGMRFDDLQISMCGPHQVKNAMAALAALCVLNTRGEVSVNRQAIYAGFRAARQPGRLELLAEEGQSSRAALLIDGAHNEDGAAALAEAVKRYLPGKRILMVTGILADKDVERVLRHFRGITDAFIATEPENPRRLSAEALAARIRQMDGQAEPVADLQKACRMAWEQADAYDVVLVAGSLYLIGAVRDRLRRLWNEGE